MKIEDSPPLLENLLSPSEKTILSRTVSRDAQIRADADADDNPRSCPK